VRAVAAGVLGDYHCAEDAAQEAFVKAYAKLGKLRRRAAFGPWILMIARRCALDAAGKRSKREAVESSVEGEMESAGGRFDEDGQRVLTAIAKLSGAQREVVVLRYFGGHDVKGVARMAGRSVGTVTKQLSRAHRRLRKILSQMEAKL